MIVLRTLAAIAGVGILAAVAHVTITATGGYGWNTNAPLTIALAVGVVLGAPVASLSRPILAVALCLALLAGDAYCFLATANWDVANIEEQAALVHDAEARHAAAKARLEAADHSAPKLDDVPAPKKVARLMIDRLEAAPRSRVESADLYAAYCDWCERRNSRALPAPQFADEIMPLLKEVGIKRKLQGDNVFLLGVKLAI